MGRSSFRHSWIQELIVMWIWPASTCISMCWFHSPYHDAKDVAGSSGYMFPQNSTAKRKNHLPACEFGTKLQAGLLARNGSCASP